MLRTRPHPFFNARTMRIDPRKMLGVEKEGPVMMTPIGLLQVNPTFDLCGNVARSQPRIRGFVQQSGENAEHWLDTALNSTEITSRPSQMC